MCRYLKRRRSGGGHPVVAETLSTYANKGICSVLFGAHRLVCLLIMRKNCSSNECGKVLRVQWVPLLLGPHCTMLKQSEIKVSSFSIVQDEYVAYVHRIEATNITAAILHIAMVYYVRFFFRFLIVIKFIPVLKSDWTVFKCFQTSWIFAKLQLWASMCFSKILLDRAQITKQYPNLWTYHWETFSLSSDTEKEYNQTATFPRHDWQAWKWKFYSEKQ